MSQSRVRRGSLADADERLALSVLRPVRKREGPARRCAACGLLFQPTEICMDVDDDGRRIGWTCYGCAG